MKMDAHREYRNDISDVIGILIEETENGHAITCDKIETAYKTLYHESPDSDIQNRVSNLCSRSIGELKAIYDSQKDSESLIGNQLITYAEEGVDITVKNAAEAAARIREKVNRE